jgi:hypothetical protein
MSGRTWGPVSRKTVWTMVDVSQVMVDHTIICKIHTSRLTILVRDEVNFNYTCTKILTFLTMKLELLSPHLFFSSCLSSKRFFLFPISDRQKPKIETHHFFHIFDTSNKPKNPVTSIVVIGFLGLVLSVSPVENQNRDPHSVGNTIDSGMGWSITIDKIRVFINKTLSILSAYQ